MLAQPVKAGYLVRRVPRCHSERSDPAFSYARFSCAGSRREESLPIFCSGELISPPSHFSNLTKVRRRGLSAGRVARTTNPDTNLGAPYAGFACGAFDVAFFLFLRVPGRVLPACAGRQGWGWFSLASSRPVSQPPPSQKYSRKTSPRHPLTIKAECPTSRTEHQSRLIPPRAVNTILLPVLWLKIM